MTLKCTVIFILLKSCIYPVYCLMFCAMGTVVICYMLCTATCLYHGHHCCTLYVYCVLPYVVPWACLVCCVLLHIYPMSTTALYSRLCAVACLVPLTPSLKRCTATCHAISAAASYIVYRLSRNIGEHYIWHFTQKTLLGKF